jgi:uncharacterized Ntn-hydrolase superfamily protein
MADLRPQPNLNTFSIVGFDPEMAEIGLAVASRAFDAGYYCTFLRSGVGGVATQSFVNPHLATLILDALEQGRSPSEALEAAIAGDELSPRRQVGVVDAQGRTAAFTGAENGEWAGHLTAPNVSVQGNLLAGPAVVESMLAAFLGAEGPLADRLMMALEAGEAAGGDKRGKQSAALTVVRKRGGFDGAHDRLVELKITDHADPIPELRRLFNLWKYHVVTPTYARLAGEEPAQAERLHEHLGRYLAEAMAAQYDDAHLYNGLAWFLAEKKLFPQQALKAAQRAVELAPENSSILDTLAEAHFAAGDMAEARRIAEQACSLIQTRPISRGSWRAFGMRAEAGSGRRNTRPRAILA